MQQSGFWTEIFLIRDTATAQVLWRGAIFGMVAGVVCLIESRTNNPIGIPIAPYEVAGAALSLLLVLRTNAGYDRWWEGRKLWGGIVNQCRNLAVTAVGYGQENATWRSDLVHWTAVFPHVLRHSLRDERSLSKMSGVIALVGAQSAERIVAADHMPSYVAAILAQVLSGAVRAGELDNFAFLEAERQRALLIDHAGACERIKKTPLPRAYSIQIRRFLFLFLATMPFALIFRIELWLTPIVTLLISYPILTLDEIGAQLQQPFSPNSLNHLPLDEICASLEKNLLNLLESPPARSEPPAPF